MEIRTCNKLLEIHDNSEVKGKHHDQWWLDEPPYQSLRPSFVTPMRDVPSHIPKPDYLLTGIPASEFKSRADESPIYTPQIEGIRVACKVSE